MITTSDFFHSPPVVFVAFAAVPIVLNLKRWLKPKPLPGIPHYPITSIWGDIPAIARDTESFGDFLDEGGLGTKAIDELGPIYQLLIGPFSRLVVVADAQEIDDVLLRSTIQRAIEASDITRAGFFGVIPHGMISLKTDDVWRRHKRIISPLMSPTYLSRMSPAISASAQLLVDLWTGKSAMTKLAGGTCFSCQDDFAYATLDSISETIVGRPISAVVHAVEQLPERTPVVDAHGGTTFTFQHQPLFDALQYLIGIMASTIRMPPIVAKLYYMYLNVNPTFRRQYGLVVKHVERCTTEARSSVREAMNIGEEPVPATSLVGMVVRRDVGDSPDKLSEVELRDEALTFLFGGQDTTSQSLQWCMKFFAKAPHVQRTLRAELLSVLDDSPDERHLRFTDVSSPEKTPYLEAVLYEVLRVGRVGAATSKATTEPVSILGHHIPAGTNLIFLNAAACDRVTGANQPNLRALDGVRSESSLKNGIGGRGLWTDPHVFDPERWLVDDGAGKTKFNLKAGVSTPFGVGVRACAGKALAQLELKMFIATLNLAFFFDKVPEELDSYKPILGITRGPRMAYVAPRPWEDNE